MKNPFKNKAKQLAIRESKYREIATYLSGEFDWNDIIRQSMLNYLMAADIRGGANPMVEYVLDHPVQAQFRLKWREEGLHVSYCPTMHAIPDKEERANRLTERVRAIQNG